MTEKKTPTPEEPTVVEYRGAEQPPRPQRASANGLVVGLGVLSAMLALGLVFTTLTTLHYKHKADRAATTVTSTYLTEQEKVLMSVARHEEGDPLAYGKADAPVTMVEFADLRCPFCAVFSNTILPDLQKYVDDGTLRIEYRDLSLFGEQSTAAAMAARAAGAQGKYHEYLVALYKAAPPEGGHPDLPTAKLVGFAEEAGVPDLAKFKQDMTKAEYRQAVEQDSKLGSAIGISGTPFFIINAQFISGARPKDDFVKMIEAEKKRGAKLTAEERRFGEGKINEAMGAVQTVAPTATATAVPTATASKG